MPVEVKPLFRPDALRPKLNLFELPARIEPLRDRLEHWARLFSTTRANKLKEKELLPDFFTDFFLGVLGYTSPVEGHEHHTFSREKYVASGGTYADAVIGRFNGAPKPVVAIEGKGPLDPLDRPFGGRKISAVDQGYTYAIDLQCDWIIVTSMRETRLVAGMLL